MLKEAYPVQKAWQLLDYPRSSYYYMPRVKEESQHLKQTTQTVAREWSTYGYRRITEQLNRQGWQVNHKRVYRFMCQMGIQMVKKAQKKAATNCQHPYPRYPELDSRPGYHPPGSSVGLRYHLYSIGEGFVSLAVIMDLFSRGIRGWNLSRGLDQRLTLIALRRALQNHTPQIHHSDHGWQYAAKGYIELLQKSEVQISMSETGEPTQNVYAERLMRTIKEEEVYLTEYEDFHDSYQNIDRFLNDVYMNKRIHSSLGYLTPVEFEHNWNRQNILQLQH